MRPAGPWRFWAPFRGGPAGAGGAPAGVARTLTADSQNSSSAWRRVREPLAGSSQSSRGFNDLRKSIDPVQFLEFQTSHIDLQAGKPLPCRNLAAVAFSTLKTLLTPRHLATPFRKPCLACLVACMTFGLGRCCGVTRDVSICDVVFSGSPRQLIDCAGSANW